MSDETMDLLKDPNGVVTPEIFEKIMNSEKIMEEIDAIPKGWYELWARADSDDLKNEISNMALQRAKSFGDYEAFIADRPHWEILSVGMLFHATTPEQFKKVVHRTQRQWICLRGAEGQLNAAGSTDDCFSCISGLRRLSELKTEHYIITEMTKGIIKKSASLAKDIYALSKLNEAVQEYAAEHLHSEKIFIITLAEELTASKLVFDRKNALGEQVALCKNCGRRKKDYKALEALLNSVLSLGKYDNYRMVHSTIDRIGPA
jgi:hypothetical protein